MRQKPRPADSPLLDRASVRFVASVGTLNGLIALVTLGVVPRFGYGLEETRAVVFHFMAVSQLFLTYPSRRTWLRPLANRHLLAAVVGGVAFQFAAAWLPAISKLLGNVSLPMPLWAVALIGALVSWALSEAIARFVWRSGEGAGCR